MSITNLDKPAVGVEEANLTIGDSFTLLVGGIYQFIINPANALAGMTNSDKVASYETWDSISTTWTSETRTWLDMGSLFSTLSKPTTTMTNLAKP